MRSFLVCYDIEDDRERTRVARVLERYGQRVQYSVFEVHLASKALDDALREELQSVIGEGADIRFYRLTVDGIRHSESLDGRPVARRDLVIVI